MIEKIIKKHAKNWQSDNFNNWKITEIMHCKIGWVIEQIDGCEELDEYVEILLDIQNFINDLQELENE